MNEVTVLARSKIRDYDLNSKIFTEWGVREVDEEEKEYLVATYGAREIYKFSKPFVSVRRRGKIINDYYSYNDWEVLDFADGRFKAGLSVGDSEYYLAESVCPLHNQILGYTEIVNNLRKELKELEDQITPNKFQKHSNLLKEYQYKYDCALKKKKLFKKASQGLVEQSVIDEIRSPIVEEYKAEETKILTRIDEIKLKLEDLKNTLDKMYENKN